jgi:dTDP-4-dehydrorhamnose reductase
MGIKILLTGAKGMLGAAIKSQLASFDLHAYSREQLDITSRKQVMDCVQSIHPDYIINCAAYTAVDQAENELDNAYLINHTALIFLAQQAQAVGATLIHFSTDYVFDGLATTPYQIDHSTSPINVYGDSKLQGELAIKEYNDRYYIFRTSWLYGPSGKNFLNWVRTTPQQELRVVDNQIGSPTSVLDLALFIKFVIENDPARYGTYHYANQGEMSWYAFAKAIIKQLQLPKSVVPIQEFKTRAVRPAYSVLDCSKTQDVFNTPIDSIETALENVLKNAD